MQIIYHQAWPSDLFTMIHVAYSTRHAPRRVAWRNEQKPMRPGPLGRLVRGDPGGWWDSGGMRWMIVVKPVIFDE